MELSDVRSVVVRPLGHTGEVTGQADEGEQRLARAQARRHRRSLEQIARYFPGLDTATVDAGHGLPSHHRQVGIDLAATMAGIDEVLSGQDLIGRTEGFYDGSQQAIDAIFASDPSTLVGAQIDSARLEEALAAGLTIRINGVQPRLPQVDDLCRQVSFALATLPNANVYLSGSTAPGLRAHVDSHDVFMVQLAGSKGWECGRSACVPQPGSGGDRDLGRIDWAGTLEAGDGLHLPRGTVHRPIPNGSLSVHVSVGARRPAWADVATWIGVDLPKGFRADVPAALACGAASFNVAITNDCTERALHHLDPTSVERALARYRFGLPVVRSASVGAVRLAMARPAAVSVRWCAPGGLCVAVDHDGPATGDGGSSAARLTVGAAGHVFTIGPADIEPLAGLLEGDQVTSGSWAGLAAGERAVAMLSRLGLVEPVEFLE